MHAPYYRRVQCYNPRPLGSRPHYWSTPGLESPCSSLNKYLVTLVTNPVTAVVCGGEPHRQAVVWVEAGGGGVYGVGSMVLKD